MKISKIPGLGRFGIFIDDLNFENITKEEWLEIGKLHLENLVTIIRNTNLNAESMYQFMSQWGGGRYSYNAIALEKYPNWDGKILSALEDPNWDLEDKEMLKALANVCEGKQNTTMRVSGKKDEHGNALGMFAEGELLWHSNESGNSIFTPGVALLAYQGTTNSSTGFLTTADYYENVSESFRSELDEMVLIHNFTAGKINPGLRADQDLMMYKNMAPYPDAEIPMVIKSPGGITGLHYSFNTVTHIKGMSKKDSTLLLDKIRKDLTKDEYIYDHWYEHDGDLCIFDNSITQHRRLGNTDNRLCYRYQFDYTYVQDGPYVPYNNEPYRSEYIEKINKAVNLLKISDFKLP